MSFVTRQAAHYDQPPKPPTRPVGRPPRLYTCQKCGKVMGAAAVRSHKCLGAASGRTDRRTAIPGAIH